MPARFFLDTEFTGLEEPRLLSLALVSHASGGGEPPTEFYVQWDPACAAMRELQRASNRFVRQQVWPALKRCVGRCVTSQEGFAQAVADVLRRAIQTQGQAAEVAYDYHTDYDLLESLLMAYEPTRELLKHLTPVHIGYLLGDEDAKCAMERSWAASLASHQLPRHHALADARALRAAFVAVHGDA